MVIYHEMVHDARIVPLDTRPHLSKRIHQWMGDGRGHWENQTLAVETTNFTNKTASFSPSINSPVGTGRTLTLIERFTRVDQDTLLYEYTIDDPAVFTRTFTTAIPMQRSELAVFEYACHEGNRGLANILAGARLAERENPVVEH